MSIINSNYVTLSGYRFTANGHSYNISDAESYLKSKNVTKENLQTEMERITNHCLSRLESEKQYYENQINAIKSKYSMYTKDGLPC